MSVPRHLVPVVGHVKGVVRHRPNSGNPSSQTGSGSGSRSGSTYRSESDSGFSRSSSQTSTMSSLSSDWGDSSYSPSDDDEDSSYSESDDKVDLTQVKKGSIYFFRCEGGFYKVGMTKRDIKQRLNEHKMNPKPDLRPKQHGRIEVFMCDDVRQAETSILRDENTAWCRVRGKGNTEYLYGILIGGVVERVVAEVNSRRPLVISYYTLNAGNEIVKVNE